MNVYYSTVLSTTAGRTIQRSLQGHERPARPFRPQESNRHTHHRVRFLRSRSRSSIGWPTSRLRVHDIQLRYAGYRSGHQLSRKDTLHVRRYPAMQYRLPRTQRLRPRCRSSALARLLELVRKHTGSESRCSMERRGRKGTTEGCYQRPQPGRRVGKRVRRPDPTYARCDTKYPLDSFTAKSSQ
jgi:hypothetical protein